MSDQHERRVAAIIRGLGPRLDDLITPALVFDLDAVEHNVAAMRSFAGEGRWRPHVKTHKHPEVVRRLLDGGVRDFKCATLDELVMLLEVGAQVDVVLAYPVTGPMARAAAHIALQHPHSTVRLLADSPEHLASLDHALRDAPVRLSALLDVDVGMHRTGTAPHRWGSPSAEHLDLVGLHGYEGHVRWPQADVAKACYRALLELASHVRFDVQWIVTSGTHAFHHALAHAALTEGPWTHQVSPGTLVLSDLRSARAAELLQLQQAAFVLSRVVSRTQPGRITLDAGSKALNPDCPPPACAAVGYPDLVALAASEEHRPCAVEGDAPRPGDLVALIPEHVCTTVNMYREVQLVRDGVDEGPTPIPASQRSHDLTVFVRR
ncbi:MAG: alanine racemase [Nannocystaceae bacterium]|nr:alanine racemase [bacterium]